MGQPGRILLLGVFRSLQLPRVAPQFLFGLLALDELTNLAANGLKHPEQFVIRLANQAAEKFNDSDNLVRASDRETKRAVESFFQRIIRPWEIGVDNHIGDPRRLPMGQYSTRKTHAGGEQGLPGAGLELRGAQLRDVPKFDAAQRSNLFIHFPDRAHFPLQALTNGLEDLGCRRLQGQ